MLVGLAAVLSHQSPVALTPGRPATSTAEHATTQPTPSVARANAPLAAPKSTQPSQHTTNPVTHFSGATISNGSVHTADGATYPLRHYTTASLPNDPNANQPWVTSADLGAAWDIPHGSAPTLLAVIDTGFALKHQEFTNRWYTNPGESGAATAENPSKLNCTDRGLPLDQSCNLIDDDGNGIVDDESGSTTIQKPSQLNCTDQGLPLDKSCNMVDDDGNGLVDDVRGYDFAYNSRSVQAGEVNPSGSGTHHGTYTTGIAAATGNNGVGIAGVDWNTTILPIQALTDDGSGDTAGVTNAINYAVDQHANVISMSLGSTYDDPLVHQAVDRALAAGISVVAAAGNDGCDCMIYPANYPEVISVGAANVSGGRASFSSYGANLTVMAPGVNLYTSDWQPSNQISAYDYASGTSLATPVISGLLTRLLSQQPTATPAQLRAALLENTNRTNVGATNRTDSFGFGLVDAGKANQRMVNTYAPLQMYAFGGLSSGDYLSSTPVEGAGGSAYQCESGSYGGTAIYLLSGAQSFFTRSIIESTKAQAQGYSSSLFSYACMTQPQDRPQIERTINMPAEFLNSYSKP